MGWLRWLNEQTWFGGGANIIQWTTLLTWGFLMHHIWHASCGHAWYCLRPGQVPVPGHHHRLCRRHAKRTGTVHQ